MALTASDTASAELIAARIMAGRKGPAGLRNNKELPAKLRDALGDSNEAVVPFSLDTKGHRLHIGEFDGYVSLGSMSVTRVRHGWMDDHVHTQFKHYILSAGEESLDFFMGDIRIDNGWEDAFNLQRQRAVVRILTEGVAL
jgi:hypothetical protein